MFRYLVVHLPCFRLERCGWSSEDLVVLVAEEKSALRVQATTPAAHQRGVRVGMTAAEARARVPELETEFLDEEGEAEDLEAITAQLLRVSPNLGTLPPDAMVAEISRLPAPPQELLLQRMSFLGHLARIVVADDPRTALAVARWGTRDLVVPPGQSAEALAPLPLEALELPPREAELLEGLGIDTVGAFAALDPAAVAGRLGPVAVAGHQVARGGWQASPLGLWETEGLATLHQDLPDPVHELEPLIFVLNASIREAAAYLAVAGQAATRLTVRFTLDDLEQTGQRWQDLALRLGRPTRDPARILALLRLRLERFQLAGPVTALSLEITETAVFTGRQRDLMGQEHADELLAEVAGRLQDSLGAHAVLVPRLADRHRPEAAWQPQAFQAGGGRGQVGLFQRRRPVSPVASALEADPVQEWRGFPERRLPPRPPILLPEARAVEVDRPADGVPRALSTDGRWLPVHEARGPEELVGEWWSHGGFRRSYWRLRLRDGRRAWVYEEDGCWLLQGWWD